jgi:peptide/nickel transport system permease protein/oligopeptide transport system permease protein
MLTMIIRKLFLGLFYLFVISVVAFVMVRQMPGDPAVLIANQDRESEAPPELVERVRQEYGFDKGIIEQYRLWLGRVLLEGDLGYSTRTKRPVLAEIKASFPPSLRLGLTTFGVTLLISFPLGLLAGVTDDKYLDLLIQSLAWTSYSIPVFLLSVLLIWLFSVELGVLPVLGDETSWHYLLPALSLSIPLSGWITPVIRSSVREITQKHYIRTAHAKGLSLKRVVLVHILKPALLPISTALLIQLGNLISGSFIIEMIFAWNGMGRLLIDSIMARDFPTIQGILLFVGGIFAVINVLIDSLYLLLDPSTAQTLGRRRSL